MSIGSRAGFTDPAAVREAVTRTLGNSSAKVPRLFAAAVPYSMDFHPRPFGGEYPERQFHAHIYPPLLRLASVRKHMVGFEMFGMPQRDLTAETAAESLRNALDHTRFDQ